MTSITIKALKQLVEANIQEALKKTKLSEGAAIVGEAQALYEKHVGFKNLVKQLTDKGHSEDSAKAIAYHIGVAKYGKKKMAQAAASHKPLSDKDTKTEGMLAQEPWTPQRVLKVMVHVLKKNPELAAMTPDEVAQEFVENIPEITDSEVITPGELEKLAAMAIKVVLAGNQGG